MSALKMPVCTSVHPQSAPTSRILPLNPRTCHIPTNDRYRSSESARAVGGVETIGALDQRSIQELQSGSFGLMCRGRRSGEDEERESGE